MVEHMAQDRQSLPGSWILRPAISPDGSNTFFAGELQEFGCRGIQMVCVESHESSYSSPGTGMRESTPRSAPNPSLSTLGCFDATLPLRAFMVVRLA
jgi:hypothetical protein